MRLVLPPTHFAGQPVRANGRTPKRTKLTTGRRFRLARSKPLSPNNGPGSGGGGRLLDTPCLISVPPQTMIQCSKPSPVTFVPRRGRLIARKLSAPQLVSLRGFVCAKRGQWEFENGSARLSFRGIQSGYLEILARPARGALESIAKGRRPGSLRQPAAVRSPGGGRQRAPRVTMESFRAFRVRLMVREFNPRRNDCRGPPRFFDPHLPEAGIFTRMKPRDPCDPANIFERHRHHWRQLGLALYERTALFFQFRTAGVETLSPPADELIFRHSPAPGPRANHLPPISGSKAHGRSRGGCPDLFKISGETLQAHGSIRASVWSLLLSSSSSATKRTDRRKGFFWRAAGFVVQLFLRARVTGRECAGFLGERGESRPRSRHRSVRKAGAELRTPSAKPLKRTTVSENILAEGSRPRTLRARFSVNNSSAASANFSATCRVRRTSDPYRICAFRNSCCSKRAVCGRDPLLRVGSSSGGEISPDVHIARHSTERRKKKCWALWSGDRVLQAARRNVA